MLTRGRLVLVLALLLTGCALHHGPSSPSASTPDLGAVLRLSTRFGLAHACPISANAALTSAHVVDPKPLDPESPLIHAMWSDGHGRSGLALSLRLVAARDLAKLVPPQNEGFPAFYPLALKAPAVGSRVHYLAYDWRTGSKGGADREVHTTVLRVVAETVFYREAATAGSSGGCLLNDAGEIVGVIDAAYPTEDHGAVGTAVAAWGLQ